MLVFLDRGTGKSIAVRAMAALLPDARDGGCRYACDPDVSDGWFDECRARGAIKKTLIVPVPMVELPLGITKDRVVGALDLERAWPFTRCLTIDKCVSE